MRTNREGNLKRFFDIQEKDLVLEVRGEALVLREAEYDYIFWNPAGAEGKEVCVQNLYNLLGPAGKLVVYFDNPLGVHAFAEGMTGEKTDVGYPLLAKLKAALSENGYEFFDKIYYPYPNVDVPCVFFSDERLPGKKECDDNFYNFDKARMEAFDERGVTDRIVDAQMYPYFANAYMLILSKTPTEEFPVYTRFSNERRADAQIRTDLYKDRVEKKAVCKEALGHILAMQVTGPLLEQSLQGVTILGKECAVNQVTAVSGPEQCAKIAFVQGESLEQILDKMSEAGKEEEVAEILLGFCRGLKSSPALSEFAMTERFSEIFGEIDNSQQYGWKTLPVSDIDLVCQNVLVSDKAVIIDHEWTFDFPVPVDFLVFRFLYFYLEAKHRTCMENKAFADLYEKAGITGEMREVFLSMETSFQHYVQSGAAVLCNSFDTDGKPVLTNAEIRNQVEKLGGKTAGGVTAKRSPEGIYLYKLPDAADGTQISLDGFDATQRACVLRVGAMADRGGVHVGLSADTNGLHLGGLLYLFENQMPKITLHGMEENDNGAEISIEEIEMSEDAIRELKKAICDMRFIIDNREQQIRDLKGSVSWKVTKPLRALKGNKEE